MNEYVRLIRHSDRTWHDCFFNFVASIFKVGCTFSAWGTRGGWVVGYDVFAVVVNDQIVSTVGRQSMRYVINGEARNGYQIGAVATHVDHRNRGLARLLINKVLGELVAPDQPVILFANPSLIDFYQRFGFSQARASSLRRVCQCASGGHASADLSSIEYN
jgi:predicted acetyltransferase